MYNRASGFSVVHVQQGQGALSCTCTTHPPSWAFAALELPWWIQGIGPSEPRNRALYMYNFARSGSKARQKLCPNRPDRLYCISAFRIFKPLTAQIFERNP